MGDLYYMGGCGKSSGEWVVLNNWVIFFMFGIMVRSLIW